MQDNKSQPLILAHSVKAQMSFSHGALSVVCPFTISQIPNCYWDFNQHKTRSDHRRIALAIQEYDTIGPYLNSNPPKSGARVNLSYSFFLFFHFNLFQVFLGCLHIPKMRCIVGLTKT